MAMARLTEKTCRLREGNNGGVANPIFSDKMERREGFDSVLTVIVFRQQSPKQ